MSLAAQLSAQFVAQRDALGSSLTALRDSVKSMKHELLRVESSLLGLDHTSDAGQVVPAIAQAQRLVDQALAVKVAATTCEHHLGVIAALRAAGSQS